MQLPHSYHPIKTRFLTLVETHDSIEFEYDTLSLFFVCFFPPRREVCSGSLLSASGSLPAHLPTWESSSPSSCTRQTVSTRKQQEQQRRGTKCSLKSTYTKGYFNIFCPHSASLLAFTLWFQSSIILSDSLDSCFPPFFACFVKKSFDLTYLET